MTLSLTGSCCHPRHFSCYSFVTFSRLCLELFISDTLAPGTNNKMASTAVTYTAPVTLACLLLLTASWSLDTSGPDGLPE
ncbi:hypothetical protein RRG08_001140, partial [Elysia crispata]